MFDIFIGFLILYAGIAFVSTIFIVPLLLREPVTVIVKPIIKEYEHPEELRFSVKYVLTTLFRYLFWGSLANIIAFFLGGFALGLVDLLVKDLIYIFFRRF